MIYKTGMWVRLISHIPENDLTKGKLYKIIEIDEKKLTELILLDDKGRRSYLYTHEVILPFSKYVEQISRKSHRKYMS